MLPFSDHNFQGNGVHHAPEVHSAHGGVREYNVSKQPSFEIGSVLFEIGCGGLLPLMGYPSSFTVDRSVSYDVMTDVHWDKWNRVCVDFPDADGMRSVIQGLLRCNPSERLTLTDAARLIGDMPVTDVS